MIDFRKSSWVQIKVIKVRRTFDETLIMFHSSVSDFNFGAARLGCPSELQTIADVHDSEYLTVVTVIVFVLIVFLGLATISTWNHVKNCSIDDL